MIRGLVYLTGLVTLALVAAVGAVAYKVHTWPWGEYIREGREVVARRLDPGSDGPERNADGNRDTSRADTNNECKDEGGRRKDEDVFGLRPSSPQRTQRTQRKPRDGESGESKPSVDSVSSVASRAVPRSLPVRRHTVRRGDTLYALAKRHYGDPMRWRQIARANDIRRLSDLKVGRLIVIPREVPAREEWSWPADLRLMLSPAVEFDD